MRDLTVTPSPPFSYDFSAPPVLSIPVEELKAFLEKDEEAVLIFYGGEPLLEMDTMVHIINAIKIPFRLQTNGLLLDRLPVPALKKIDKILVSLDGTRQRTDFNRGQGTYDKVIKNVNFIRSRGYAGEIIARMTIAQEFPDIFEQVLSLIEMGFSSIHWQLDAGFYSSDFDESRFSWFVKEYTRSLDDLIEWWMTKLKNGTVFRIYPFIGIIASLLQEEWTPLRCGAGHSGYAIRTDGVIAACPIMTHIQDFVCGTLDTHPRELYPFRVSGRCYTCSIAHICGGRCLYWNKAGLWPEKGDDLICETIFHLIQTLESRIDDIEALIVQECIAREDFSYEKYFGPEIIP
jgi:putative peptide-modifying radical SAM enzyme